MFHFQTSVYFHVYKINVLPEAREHQERPSKYTKQSRDLFDYFLST